LPFPLSSGVYSLDYGYCLVFWKDGNGIAKSILHV
jgi:hypothetical protein